MLGVTLLCHSTAFSVVCGKMCFLWTLNTLSSIHKHLGDQIHCVTYSVEPVINKMFQIFAHPDLSHQLVLVAVHASQLTHMSKDVLQPIRQLQYEKG